MPKSHLFLSEFGLDKSQSGILILSLRSISPITSSNIWHISLKLTIIIAYYLE